ncbi:MAG: acetyl-CoA acetyltransferase [Zetaproteobacteria bacterium CG2_30_46_52]|nr:MAG: acetyl-CoA acetyltransferase [Zetaproteobacteria bacterium CG2_30_46_52]
MKKRKVYVVDGLRTPFLKARGKRGTFSASDLAVQAGRSLLMRMPFQATDLDEVIIGCVMPEPNEANIARIIALRLGAGNYVPAWTVQRNCASGMQAIDAARLKIMSGESDLILAGGTEAMSRAPLLMNATLVDWLADWRGAKTVPQKLGMLSKVRPNFFAPVIAILQGLTDPIVGLNMGQTAENLAFKFGVSREEMDAFAMESHLKISKAMRNGDMDEIMNMVSNSGDIIAADDGVRADSTMEKLAKLSAVFDRVYGLVTAGNSAQITDGAAMLVLASDVAVKKYKLPVLGTIDDVQWAALEPEFMGLGPAYAIPPLLQRNNMGVDDVQAWEINEAFAVQVQANVLALNDDAFCQKALGLDAAFGVIAPEKLNREGGAIAIGHPIGASGARIVLHILKGMQKRGEQKGVAAICIGGGQGGAVLVSGGAA